MPVPEPLLVPMPVEPPAPVEGAGAGVGVEPVEPPADEPVDVPPVAALPELLSVVLPLVLPEAPLLEPTPAEPAPCSRRQRSFSGPAESASQFALVDEELPVAALPVALGDVVPLMLGEVELPLTLGEGVLGEVVLPLAPVLDCEVLLPVVPEAPVEPLVLPEPDVWAKAVRENARSAAVPIVFNMCFSSWSGGKKGVTAKGQAPCRD